VLGCGIRIHDDGLYDLVVPDGVDQIDFVEMDGAWAAMPLYSTDIAAAWTVFQDQRRQLFSKRMAFFRQLGRLLQKHPELKSGCLVAWPDAMMFLTPEKICKAALLAVLEAGHGRDQV
jgi:hypothetical protein